jgi:hypothetical protein
MKPIKNLFSILVFTFFTITRAQDITVLLGTVTNLSQQDGDAIRAVIAKKYSDITGKRVFDLSKAQEIYSTNNQDIQAVAKELQISEYIIVSAIALREKMLIDAVRYNDFGQEVFRSETITAVTLDDLPEVADRLARALYNKTIIDKTITTENVTAIETLEKNRFFAEKIIGVKIGLIKPLHTDSTFQELITIGFHMKAESEKFFIEYGLGAIFPTRFKTYDYEDINWAYGGINFELGGAYYLTNNPAASLFVGGGFNPRILFEPGAVIITPYISFGVMFFRPSSMRIFTNIRIAQNVFEIPFERYIYDEQTWENYYYEFDARPFEIGLEVGIGW